MKPAKSWLANPMTSDPKSIDLSAPVTDRDHIRGSLEAPVLIVEYGDYECPHCGRAYWVVRNLLAEHPDDVSFVFRNFPVVEKHPRAETVAEALEAAGAQGQFWEMHDWFYERQHQLELSDLEEHARQIGLDVDLWKREMQAGNFKDRVKEDLETGRQSGVSATPTFFINGRRYAGRLDHDSLAAAIREELSSAAG
jgi:protein-disulfide isomerase